MLKFRALFSPRQFLLSKALKRQFIKCGICTTIIEDRLKKLNYYLILDFEATCDRSRKFKNEIIEFPCLKINADTLVEEGRFHRFVRPTVNPILTEFCVELTGILQEIVDNEETFPEVYKAFEEWRAKENLTDENSLYITSGDWDFGHMMPVQCQLCNLEMPSHMHVWTDIKKVFADNTGTYKSTLKEILNYYNMPFVGRLHSGLDDCLNLGNLVRCLIHSNAVIYPTSKLIHIGERRKVDRIKLVQKDPLKHLSMKPELKFY